MGIDATIKTFGEGMVRERPEELEIFEVIKEQVTRRPGEHVAPREWKTVCRNR